jgi:thiol-disulfide isomerase/thioredoxin
VIFHIVMMKCKKTAKALEAAAEATCLVGAHRRGGCLRRKLILGVGGALIVCVWLFREPLRRQIFAQGVLANDAPTEEAVHEMIQNAADPQAAIVAVWNTGKIAQRLLAIQKLSSVGGIDKPLPANLRNMLLAAALDPDMDVREIALGALDSRNDPALPALSAAQLNDLDPQVRLLGLTHLRKLSSIIGVPVVVPLLKDINPQILACALRLLEDWSGENFGVKLSDAVPLEDAKTGLTVFEEASYHKTRAGVDRAATWWAEHKAEFQPVQLEIPSEALTAAKSIYAGDFTLPTIGGQSVRLSDFRGKVVFINFWATWCTACVSELPELIALQKGHNDNLEILGVSLDFVPDEDNPTAPSSPEMIRKKVAQTVALRGINYPVLLDEKNAVGGRFNGGELPTTVLIDAQGRIRRRFIGARSLPVFEAMVVEASKPITPIQTAR